MLHMAVILFILKKARDSFDTSPTSQSSDSRLGNSLDVVSEHLPMTLGASLSESFSSFASASHGCDWVNNFG